MKNSSIHLFTILFIYLLNVNGVFQQALKWEKSKENILPSAGCGGPCH